MIRFLFSLLTFIGGLPLAHSLGFNDNVILEFPRGRFSETSPPQFFKWSIVNPVKNQRLKIYKKSAFSTQKDQLMISIDFTGTARTYTWNRAPFMPGQYYWVIETYGEKSPEPITSAQAGFSVDKLRSLNLHSSLFGPLLGMGVGSYESVDDTFVTNFDITPRIYGLSGNISSGTSIWGGNLMFGDYSVDEEVRYPIQISNYYLWQLFGISPYKTEGFFGPLIKYYTMPEARTTDGFNFNIEDITFIAPGFRLAAHRQFSSFFTLHAYAELDTPVHSTSDIELSTGVFNYLLAAGFLFDVVWPLGINFEVQYKSQTAEYENSGENVSLEVNAWNFVGQVFYTF